MKILHILNGDGTAYPFKQSGLEGDIYVWREALALGPVNEDISTPEFFEMRKTI